MMSDQQLASDPKSGAIAAAPSAAQLAARIQIPRRLPPGYGGAPLHHLSHSRITKFWLCRLWRRYYICGERSAPTGSMFLGRRVDDAITLYYQQILEHGDRLSLEQLKDAYRDTWHAEAEAEAQQLGIAWEEDLAPERAFGIGIGAIELSFRELIPRRGEPVAVQRKLGYVLAPGLESGVHCFLDLETVRHDHGELVPAVIEAAEIERRAGRRSAQSGRGGSPIRAAAGNAAPATARCDTAAPAAPGRREASHPSPRKSGVASARYTSRSPRLEPSVVAESARAACCT